jgi:hypothetical protein
MQKRFGNLLLLATLTLVVTSATTDTEAAMSEIDSFEAAVMSPDKEAALTFIEQFRSSHLVDDLIELLRPEVAHDVCANLPSGAAGAREACQRIATRLAAPHTATEKSQQIPSWKLGDPPERLQGSVQAPTSASGIRDDSSSSESTMALRTQGSIDRVSTSDTSREGQSKTAVIPLPPKLGDRSAPRKQSREEPEKAPKPTHGVSLSDDPFPGGDPGSGDTGGANSPQTHGSDPGSGDPGDGSDTASDHDSHH